MSYYKVLFWILCNWRVSTQVLFSSNIIFLAKPQTTQRMKSERQLQKLDGVEGWFYILCAQIISSGDYRFRMKLLLTLRQIVQNENKTMP